MNAATVANLHPLLQAAMAALLLIGGLFLLVGAIGLLRFEDFYMRLHAPTKASTLGLGALLLASMLWHAGQGQWLLRELLVTLFIFVTAPVSAQMMAMAALHLRLASSAPLPDELDLR
ncbi:MAG: Na+/H+ antiporter subunit G [Aquincola sp.]|uniref:Na+/H+ antiporter subunit G n=1 Tax=uncultured Aquincola sp. TaxID=886556 RepID=UPI0032B287B6|nr:Na+/H+ antiporter subunit G [Aquincola sp.]|tara:strand:- start:1421 stop:1774 length:354 start_codon:yes stop_codon:yes gene_type:complete